MDGSNLDRAYQYIEHLYGLIESPGPFTAKEIESDIIDKIGFAKDVFSRRFDRFRSLGATVEIRELLSELKEGVSAISLKDTETVNAHFESLYDDWLDSPRKLNNYMLANDPDSTDIFYPEDYSNGSSNDRNVIREVAKSYARGDIKTAINEFKQMLEDVNKVRRMTISGVLEFPQNKNRLVRLISESKAVKIKENETKANFAKRVVEGLSLSVDYSYKDFSYKKHSVESATVATKLLEMYNEVLPSEMKSDMNKYIKDTLV